MTILAWRVGTLAICNNEMEMSPWLQFEILLAKIHWIQKEKLQILNNKQEKAKESNRITNIAPATNLAEKVKENFGALNQ